MCKSKRVGCVTTGSAGARQNAVHWGSAGPILGFWVSKMILNPKIVLRKTCFLTPKSAFLHTNWAKMGSTGGVYRVNFWFLRVPDSLGVEIMQKKNLEKKIFGLFWPKKDLEKFRACPPKNRPKSARMGPVGVWGPLLALLGPFWPHWGSQWVLMCSFYHFGASKTT